MKYLPRLCLALLFVVLSACGAKEDAAPKKAADIPGACECVTECANTTNVEDVQALANCKNACAKRFGAAALAEGLKRSMEVMSGARESCGN